MKKILKVITDTILVVLIALVCVMFLPKIFGIQPLQVLTGSMEPTYHVGSLVYVQKTDSSKIEVGDAITFHLTSDTLVTHRVVEKDDSAQTFTTKGDANETVDGSSVSYSNLVGKVVFNIPYLGYIAAFVSTKSGLIVMVAAILAVLILTFIPDLFGKEDYEGKEVNEKVEHKVEHKSK